MSKKLLLTLSFIVLLSMPSYGQCAGVNNNACTTPAPTVIGNSITCTPPNNEGGRRNFLVTNMVAGATYRVSNCGSGFDTQLTIRDAAGVAVGFADDDGPDCFGLQASLDFIPPADGDYRIHLNRWNCATANNLNGDIVVTYLAAAPPPVTNDDCANAFALTVNATCTFTTYTNAGATDSGVANPGCGGYGGGDVWFSVVVPASGNIVIDSDTGIITDSGMALYSGNCGGLTLIECDDDDSDNGLMSSITATGLTAGDTVYIRFWEFGNNNNGTFDICVSEPPPTPTNDTCAGAINLTPDYFCNYTTFTNASALDSGVADPGCGFYAGGDVWFSVVVPPSGDLTIDTQAGDITDSGMALYTGTCGALTLLECDDDGSTNGAMSLIDQTGLTPGDTVFIRVWEFGNNNNGTFGICVTTTPPPGTNGVTICVGDPSEPLTTDISCFAPGTTSLGSSYTGNLNAATDPVAQMPEIFIQSADPCAFEPETSNYTSVDFTVTVDGTYIFAMEPPTPDFDAMGYIVVNDGNFVPGSCATGTWIAGDDDDGPNLDPQITANLQAGVNYTLYTTKFAFTNTTHTGPFTWNISTPAVPVEWYTSATGGTPIGTGNIFDPVGVAGSGLADTNTIGTTSFWAGCPGVLPREQADFVINNCVTCKTWNGSVSSDWNTGGNWTPTGVPTSTNCVIIPDVATDPILAYPGAPIPPNPGFAGTLTIENNGYLEITSGTSLAVTDEITIQGNGALDIRDTGSLIQVNDASVNSGNIRMQRTVGSLNGDDYVYWSSPVNAFDVSNISPGTAANLIWEWTPSVANNFGEWINASGAMTQGKGYIVRDIIGTTPASTPTFIGVANNGIISPQITRGTYTGPDYVGPGDTFVTAQDDNWNLIGNPYPSAVSYTDFISDPNNNTIDGTIYLWTHQNPPSAIDSPFYEDFFYNYSPNDYIDNNYTGSNPPGFNGFIGAGQSFFVLMLDTGTTTESVTFNNAMRGVTNNNSVFYGPSEENNTEENRDANSIERHRIWLDLITPDDRANSILVGYVEGATNEDDRLYDGYEFAGSPVSFYSIAEEKNMSIQGRALPFNDLDTVPLGLVVPQNNTYRIAINTLDGLFVNTEQDIFIEDTYTNTIHDLRASLYTFTSEAGTFNDRFILRYTYDTLGTDEFEDNSGISIISVNESIEISSNNHPIKDIILYDLLGRTIMDLRDINSLEHNIIDLQLSKSAYIVKVTLYNDVQKIKKIVH